MIPGSIAVILQRGLMRRTLLPAVICLVVMALVMAKGQEQMLGRQNEELAKRLAHYVEHYMDGVWRGLEHFVDTSPKPGHAVRREALGEMLGLAAQLERVLLVDSSNTVVASVPPAPEGVDFPIRFDEASGRRLLLSRPIYSAQTAKTTVFIGVRALSGETLVAELDLSEMTANIETMAALGLGEVVVCDAYGNVISHPDARQVATQANLGGDRLFGMDLGSAGYAIFEQDEGIYLGARAPVKVLGWKVMVSTPVGEALAPLLAPVVGAASLMGVVFLVLTLMLRRELHRRIVRPMAAVVHGLDGLTPGAQYQPSENPAFSELARFEKAIVAMGERIQEGEAILRENERRFRALFEQAAVGLTQCTLEGRYLRANRRFQQIVGYTMDELRRMTFRDITDPSDIPAEEQGLEALQRSGEAFFEQEKRYVRKDGGLIWVHLSMSAVRGEEGRILYFIGVAEDITARKTAEQALLASLAEKEVLLREIHHRVKNNLQVISSLLYLQSDHLQDPEALAMFQESRNRIGSMALVHEELYRSGDLSSVPVEPYLQRLVPRLLAASCDGRDISCKLDVDDVQLVVDQAIPFGLIVNELVTNSLKHAFKGRERGEVAVSVRLKGGEITLRVEDDGVGLPPDFDLEGTATLGMQLVVQLAMQLRGRLCVRQGSGAAFECVFQAKEPSRNESRECVDR
ncbi:sensor histidine kinase [Fundidesulfovibrio agrisoli]|uniref:sensor histidine kinase n=1 Tax=Fundidesulfovibrio agrisoli TaxID=2922717 RepID=UPI001FABE193|nr:histidine kinase dimerization/phosphoacceptor domain -containing protein [Fundidesulfovibrio agrisoli]